MKTLSIIIVNYKVKKEILACIASIYKSKPKASYEIIVVDNDEKPTLGMLLKKMYPKAMYLKGKKNIGFGAGNNMGAQYAKGDSLFFLNPDTIVLPGAIDNLVTFITKNKKIGI